MFLKLYWCYVIYNIHGRVYRGLVPVFGHLLVVTHLPSYFNREKRQKSPSSFQFRFHIYTGNCLQYLRLLVSEILCCYTGIKVKLLPSTCETLAGTERIKQGEHKHQVRLTSLPADKDSRTAFYSLNKNSRTEQPLLLSRTLEHNCTAWGK